MGGGYKDEYFFRRKFGYLVKGMVHAKHFQLLVELSSVRSTKGICALEDYLVKGRDLKEVCNEHGITSSYFTSALRRLQEVNFCVIDVIPYYRN
ncbi:hypothetical protein CSM67_004257 [Salmonella enterica subsp. diarizonae]|nr:hypothetical protein [Salmonella enterica subsp. diarizonae]EDV3465794.1 hypothetical protein [Salmonella enterica subsp. diarizonae]